jgi:glycosyltransferase involved in cell wall biosynthesis
MRVAVVHDWLNGMRGGEKVLEAILELYPDATIYTLFHERGKVSPVIESHRIVTSWLNQIPGVYRFYRHLLPLFPAAAGSLDLRGFDLVISSSHAVAKGVRTGPATHICYCHTPMRYIWDAEEDYAFNGLQRAAMKLLRGRLRRWDCETAQRVDKFITNSRFVQKRIRDYYGRDSEVIYPPVNTRFFMPQAGVEREEFYLAAGALVRYKRIDLVVEAFNRLGHALVVAGSGPELGGLRKIAGPNIAFRGAVTDEELRRLYRHARAVVLAAREDFGMVAVEAQSCGCPVIAFAGGGLAEAVRDGISGVLFAEQHVDDIVHAVRRFEGMTWTLERVRQQVEVFSREKFQDGIRKFINERIGTGATTRVAETQPA